MDNAINIVLDQDEEAPEYYFVEIEDDDGNSVKIGEWLDPDENGLMRIRITVEDMILFSIKNHQSCGCNDCDNCN